MLWLGYGLGLWVGWNIVSSIEVYKVLVLSVVISIDVYKGLGLGLGLG